MRSAPHRAPLPLVLAVGLLLLGRPPAPGAAGEGAPADAAASAFDTAALEAFRAEGVVLALRDDGHGGRALEVAVEHEADWVRVTWQGLPADIRTFRDLVFRARVRGEAPGDWEIHLRDAAQRTATLHAGLVGGGWQEVTVRLGRLRPEEGFDPEHVVSLAFVAHHPSPQVLDLDDLVLRPGEGGWRLTDEERALEVFGEEAARRLRHKAVDGFLLWSDDAGALRKATARLAKARALGLRMLGLTSSDVPPIAVYVFGDTGAFRTWCQTAYGWSEAAAQRAKARGQRQRLVLQAATLKDPVVAGELARALVLTRLGSGGGSWFQDGLAELAAAQDAGRDPVQELLPRFRAELPWSLGGLVRAADVTGSAAAADATQRADYSAIRREAAALAAFLTEAPDQWLGDARLDPPGPHLAAGLEAVARLTAEGAAREQALEALLGLPLLDLEARWVRWALRTRR